MIQAHSLATRVLEVLPLISIFTLKLAGELSLLGRERVEPAGIRLSRPDRQELHDM